jgi:hypothetical protein
VPNISLGASALSAIERGRTTHRQCEQGEAGGQRQGPQANGGLTRGTEAAADGEADDRETAADRDDREERASGAGTRPGTLAPAGAGTVARGW